MSLLNNFWYTTASTPPSDQKNYRFNNLLKVNAVDMHSTFVQNLKRHKKNKHQKEQADLSVNSNHSDGDRNGNATVQIQDALGDALNVDMIIVTK